MITVIAIMMIIIITTIIILSIIILPKIMITIIMIMIQVNSDAEDDPNSAIAGMPVLKVRTYGQEYKQKK